MIERDCSFARAATWRQQQTSATHGGKATDLVEPIAAGRALADQDQCDGVFANHAGASPSSTMAVSWSKTASWAQTCRDQAEKLEDRVEVGLADGDGDGGVGGVAHLFREEGSVSREKDCGQIAVMQWREKEVKHATPT